MSVYIQNKIKQTYPGETSDNVIIITLDCLQQAAQNPNINWLNNPVVMADTPDMWN